MPPLFKNVAPTAWLEKGDTVRVGFMQEHAYLARDASFATDFGSLWSKLFGVGKMAFPISRNGVVKGQTGTVVDFRMTTRVTAAEFVRALEDISGYFIEVASIERLTPTQARNAPTNAGAVEREADRVEDQRERADESLFGKLSKGFGMALTTTKWVAIAVGILAVVLLVAYGKDILPKLKRR